MAAPNLKEIEWAIAELEQEESSFPVYAKLADLYTVRDYLRGNDAATEGYSLAAAPVLAGEPAALYGDSEFLQAVAGKDNAAAWMVMDELMDTLRVVNQRAYESVMRKLSRL